MSEDDNKIEIDLQRKETEAGWITVIDRFGLKAAPIWFSWISWVLALGVLHFIYEKTNNIIILLFLILSYYLLWMYFSSFFFRIQIKGFPLIKSAGASRSISLILSGLLAGVAWVAATHVAQEIARFQ